MATDSEPDTFAQDVYRGVLLGMIGVREHKELDRAEEKMELWCSYNRGFS